MIKHIIVKRFSAHHNAKKRKMQGDCKRRNETKRNETQQKRNKIKQKRNETKPKKSSINKKKRFFLHETTIHQMPVADWKTFKIYGKIWLWKKKIIRISYQKADHFPASCVLCKFLRFIEKEKYIWLIPNTLSRKRRSTKSPHGLQYGGKPHHNLQNTPQT